LGNQSDNCSNGQKKDRDACGLRFSKAPADDLRISAFQARSGRQGKELADGGAGLLLTILAWPYGGQFQGAVSWELIATERRPWDIELRFSLQLNILSIELEMV
jgi:hypothetical protein